VLSAVEGLEVVQPSFKELVVPITIGILIGLFVIQKMGTQKVGRLFGPIMLIWFATLGGLGLHQILQHPGIVKALSPHYAVDFFFHHKLLGFFALSAVVLTITGAEALYADMGHFGRKPIVRAWLIITFPCLTLNYLGQGALILHTPKDISNPFFYLAPKSMLVPLVVLAAMATVIASQAVISGAFSVTRQATQLGYLPRVRISHTSHDAGQIYVPAVNWMLLVSVLALVLMFGSSAALAGAYGIAVTACTAIDTLLFFFVVRVLWKKSPWLAGCGALLFLSIDLSFLAACATKFAEGGYIPVGIGAVVCLLLMTWQRGRSLLTERRMEREGSLQDFIHEIHQMDPPLARTPGTAVFLHPGDSSAPLAMRANVEHNHTLHEQAVILWIQTEQVPHVPPHQRLVINDLGYSDDGISHITARFGFQDRPNIPRLLHQAQASGQLESEIDIDGASYFLSKMEIRRSRKPGMSGWRKRIFTLMSRLASDPVAFFYLPYDQAVIMGSHVEL
jgi:KUP system potassium uptake protein